MDWHDMRPYYQGKDPEGRDRFCVPLPTDEDGMVGRECPRDDCAPRYFKIALREETSPDASIERSAEESKDNTLYCPYCGYQADTQEFTTPDQLEWLRSLIVRDMVRTIQGSFKKAFGSSRSTRGKLFSVRLSYKPGRLPSVRHYAEKKLKRIVKCDECGNEYAVYGIAIYCPRCGRGNLHVHLKRSVEIIRTLLDMKTDVERQGGSEAGYHLLGNCLEDCVSLFEGVLRVIYSQALRRFVSTEARQQKLSDLRNSFQNLSRAENIIRSDLGWGLLDNVLQSERDFLEVQFAKRHVITHNLGLVDERYRALAQNWQQPGQDIEINAQDVARLLSIVEAILQAAIMKLDSKVAHDMNS